MDEIKQIVVDENPIDPKKVETALDLIDIESKESKQEFLCLSEDCLQKARLVELHERLRSL